MSMADAYRAAIELMYTGTCDIYELVLSRDETTGITGKTESLVLSGIPCRLSFSGSPSAAGSDTATAVTQSIELFLAPGVEVPAGCRIDVTQNGRTVSYKQSGQAEVYATHQEIMLELFDGWA